MIKCLCLTFEFHYRSMSLFSRSICYQIHRTFAAQQRFPRTARSSTLLTYIHRSVAANVDGTSSDHIVDGTSSDHIPDCSQALQPGSLSVIRAKLGDTFSQAHRHLATLLPTHLFLKISLTFKILQITAFSFTGIIASKSYALEFNFKIPFFTLKGS